ncbi:hypothetical protein [Stygiolobus caldivivus]|uniref:Uncharacterized protein n=1 Tax=Stygiolobus caldivivus TaxID=2824673 RepID=A0A8D5U5C8_9CREN|nr:hypothetical protein [Stygiolobus caldivivus]BCU69552.1 hypothetical protein KN1_08490 [Stygiolobus caldivivus]
MKVLFKSIVVVLIAVALVTGFIMFEVHGATSNTSNNKMVSTTDPKYVGSVYIYNVSALDTFISSYGYNVSNITDVFGEGVVHIIDSNFTKGTLGYIQVKGPEASFIFYELNSTLVQHGFKEGSYKNLIYYYANKTAVGFDGHYIYFAHDNVSTSYAINMLISLYNSPKVLPTPVSGLILKGYIKNTSFEEFAKGEQIILKANSTSANFTRLEKVFHFFLFETHKYEVSGHVILRNSTQVVYELQITYKGQSLYAVVGIMKGNNGITYGDMIISPQQINYSEIYNYM